MTLPKHKDYFAKYIHHIDRDNNMNAVRYVLAFGVLIAHFNYLCGAEVPWFVSSYNRVGGFFALSGFVLIGSLLKGMGFKTFTIKRMWRILPSYFLIVIAGSICLVLLTELDAYSYFTSSKFWKYLAANLCFLNFLEPSLPGVFTGPQHVMDAVNGALWTMKVEWQLSLTAPLFVWLCLRFRWHLRRAVIVLLVISLSYRVGIEYLYSMTHNEMLQILGRQFLGQLFFFYGGILVYTYYPLFVKYKKITVITSCLLYFGTWFTVGDSGIFWIYFQPFIITFFVLSLSLVSNDVCKYIDNGHNISYEIFLCHFPVIQLVAHYRLLDRIGVAGALCITIVATLAVSIAVYLLVGRLYRTHPARSANAGPSRHD